MCLNGGADTIASRAQGTCCDCCKSGDKAAAKRQDCDHVDFADPLCTHAYKECCNARKKYMPVGKLKIILKIINRSFYFFKINTSSARNVLSESDLFPSARLAFRLLRPLSLSSLNYLWFRFRT